VSYPYKGQLVEVEGDFIFGLKPQTSAGQSGCSWRKIAISPTTADIGAPALIGRVSQSPTLGEPNRRELVKIAVGVGLGDL